MKTQYCPPVSQELRLSFDGCMLSQMSQLVEQELLTTMTGSNMDAPVFVNPF